MSRPAARALPALLVLSALACASPTAPAATSSRSQLDTPRAGASFDDLTPPDTTCRSGYIMPQGRTC